MSDITFYTNPQSRGRIVHWLLEELAEPYDTEWIDYGEQMKGAEYLAVNPMGKVPAIKHRGAVVTETPAICNYLAVSYPDKNLIPAHGDPGVEIARHIYVGSKATWEIMPDGVLQYDESAPDDP